MRVQSIYGSVCNQVLCAFNHNKHILQASKPGYHPCMSFLLSLGQHKTAQTNDIYGSLSLFCHWTQLSVGSQLYGISTLEFLPEIPCKLSWLWTTVLMWILHRLNLRVLLSLWPPSFWNRVLLWILWLPQLFLPLKCINCTSKKKKQPLVLQLLQNF